MKDIECLKKACICLFFIDLIGRYILRDMLSK